MYNPSHDDLLDLPREDLERISREERSVSVITGGDMEIAGTENIPTERAMLARRLLDSVEK